MSYAHVTLFMPFMFIALGMMYLGCICHLK